VTRKQFAKTLKAWRDWKGFTQTEAAKHLGISVRTLQNWEIERNMPRGYGLAVLVKVISQRSVESNSHSPKSTVSR
jgi:DNA-binding transcriptional regulator YiaG